MNPSPEQRLATFASQVRALRCRLRDQSSIEPTLAASIKAIKQFQSSRLALSHADLLTHPRYGDAAKFFLFDLYGVKDFSQRDAELARVIPALQRFLPRAALSVIADAVQLDALSEQLDFLVGQQLQKTVSAYSSDSGSNRLNSNVANVLGAAKAGVSLGLKWPLYRAAYCIVDADAQSRAMRVTQMQLVMSIGLTLNGLVRKPLLGGLLKSMGPVAMAAGVGTMHDFLTRGFTAYKSMQDAQPFLQIIQSREQSMHDASVSSATDDQVLESQSLIGLA